MDSKSGVILDYQNHLFISETKTINIIDIFAETESVNYLNIVFLYYICTTKYFDTLQNFEGLVILIVIFLSAPVSRI